MPREDELPRNTAAWRADPARAMLLIHDMQKYFLRPFPAGRPPVTDLIRNVVALRECAARSGVPVAYTAQPGSMTEEQRGLLKDFWGPGMRATPEERAILDELAPTPDDTVFTKWRPSAFVRTDLLDTIRRHGRDQLLVCGIYGHVGILMTANDAYSQDIETFVVADAVADFSADYHRLTLDYAASRCAFTLSTQQAIAMLTNGAGR